MYNDTGMAGETRGRKNVEDIETVENRARNIRICVGCRAKAYQEEEVERLPGGGEVERHHETNFVAVKKKTSRDFFSALVCDKFE